MKRLLCAFLLLFLLCGCGAPEGIPTVVPEETIAVPVLVPTEAPGALWESGNELEALTDGIVKSFPLEQGEGLGILPFGEDMLLFTDRGLVKISGSQPRILAEYRSASPIYPREPAVHASEKGMTFFDAERCQLVFLDTGLQEVRRVDLPESIYGSPGLSADRKHLYYFTAEGLREINLDTGIDRLIRQMANASQSVTGLHCNDSILEYAAVGHAGSWYQGFVELSTGQLLLQSSEGYGVYTAGDRYFATVSDGSYTEKLTGFADDQEKMLYIPYLNAQCFPILEHEAVITAAVADGSRILDYYDLTDGSRPYSLTLPARWTPREMTADSSGNAVWMLLANDEGQHVLCCWDLSRSGISDDTAYVGIRRTESNPDEYGLSQCVQTAAELSERFGVEILVWQDAIRAHPRDYTLTCEYQVLPIQNALDVLQRVLSEFPEGFFREAASRMGDGTLRICLVRGISETPDGSAGLQFRDEKTGNLYLCIQIGQDLEQSLYHGLYHVLESRVLSTGIAFDNWADLNPEGFSYDLNDSDYLSREAPDLIRGDTRAFVDYYSMTFPKEDRARIMEYASMPGNEEMFRPRIMQAKLLTLCRGIRQAYGLEDYPEPLLWEQYLAEPICPCKKKVPRLSHLNAEAGDLSFAYSARVSFRIPIL